MRVKGQICCLQLDATRGWGGFLNVIVICGVWLLPRVSNAGSMMGGTGSALAAPTELPIDLIVAVGIFIGIFMLRKGRFDGREYLRQDQYKDEQDQ